MLSTFARTAAAGLFAVAASIAAAASAAPLHLKIGLIEPFSGGGASSGDGALRTLQFMVEHNNKTNPNVKLEIVPYDNKLNPQESLVQAQKAIDAGIRVLAQGTGSAIAFAIVDFVNKYNERNPGKEILYLNYSAIDPALTNAKCSYWHFRFDSSTDIKMDALTTYIAKRPDIKKIYLLNQDYSYGYAVRDAARAMLKQKRPDIEIVGDAVTPLQKVTDFSPYISKIKASGADTVITGNWSQDLSLMMKAVGDAGLQVNIFTYSGGSAGIPSAIRQANLSDRVFQVSEGHANIDAPLAQELEKAFRAKNGQDLIFSRIGNLVTALVKAVETAQSTDPKQIARVMESLRIKTMHGKEAFFRPDDHQMFQPLYISKFGPIDTSKALDSDGTGWGWSTVSALGAQETVLPTTCRMDRPN